MQRRHSTSASSAIAALALVAGALFASTASAAPTAPFLGRSTTSVQYGAFGNTISTGGLGDCMLAAIANLTRRTWPTVPITTAEVTADYHAYYARLGGTGFGKYIGFDGHFIAGFTPVHSRAQIIRGANTTGLYAIVMQETHAVAIIAASSKTITITTWGRIYKMTWPEWRTWDATTIDAITWEPAGSVALTYESNVGAGTPQRLVLGSGANVTVAPAPVNSDPGVVFEGWSASPLESGTLYQPGQQIAVRPNTILWAEWSV